VNQVKLKFDDERNRRRFLVFIGLFLAYWLLMANGFFATIRASSPRVNYLIFVTSLAIPLVLLAMIPFLRGVPPKVLAILLLLPTFPISILLGAFAVLDLPAVVVTGNDPTFARVSSTSLEHSDAVLYLSDGGATTSPCLIVRQELKLAPGVLLVRRVADVCPAADGKLEAVRPGLLRIQAEPYVSRPNHEEKSITVKPYVYF
jgi:hypothetical protein